MNYWIGRLFCLSVMALGSAAPALAQRPPSTSMMCEPTVAQAAKLADIAADPKSWLGKCVTIAGVYANERIYADTDAIYGMSKASIGGYVDNRGSMLGFWRGEFTGRIGDCQKAQSDIDSGLLKSPGILIDNTRQAGCVKPEGLFLQFMSQGKLAPAGLARRLAPARGDLITPQKDWDHVDTLRLAGERFLAALQSKDRAGLKDFVGGDYAVEQVLSAEDTAFAQLRKTSGPLPWHILESTAASEPHFEGLTCWCLTKDCAKLWPIATRDADNQKGRPYACIKVRGETNGGPGSGAAAAETNYDGLPEPKR